MVKLHTSLLAITLAMGSALADSRPHPLTRPYTPPGILNPFVTREGLFARDEVHWHRGPIVNPLPTREFVDEHGEDLFARDDAFNIPIRRRDLTQGDRYYHPGDPLGPAPPIRREFVDEPEEGLFARAKGHYYTPGGPFIDPIKIRDFVDEREQDLFLRDLDAFDVLEAREPAGGGAARLAIKAARNAIQQVRRHGSKALDVASMGSMAYGAFGSSSSSQPHRRR